MMSIASNRNFEVLWKKQGDYDLSASRLKGLNPLSTCTPFQGFGNYSFPFRPSAWLLSCSTWMSASRSKHPPLLINPVYPHRGNILQHKLHFMERHPLVKPFHHWRHVGEEAEDGALIGLLLDGFKYFLADLLL